jgi:hypothetical protein
MALAEHDPALMLECWRAINQLAMDELFAGFRAHRAIATQHETPWEQAEFLALRSSFILEWQPRGVLEMTLIDTLAQAQTLYERWLRRLLEATALQTEQTRSLHSYRGAKEPPRISDAQAVEQAAQMVERFHRMFLRALRQLGDLRRYTPTPGVTIQNADQVNIGGQQVNVAKEKEID